MINADFDLNALKVFIAVYENKGIEKASKKLFISQPAVSISIKKLEEKLGSNLFIRLPKGIIPTQEAEDFYQKCKTGIVVLNNAVLNFSKETALEKGLIKIGASTSVIKKILIPVLQDFCKQYPKVKVSFTEVIASRLQRYLTNGNIDIAFMEEPIKDLNVFDSHKICKFENVFIVSKQENSSHFEKEELKKQNFAVLKQNTTNRDLFEDVCLKNDINLSVNYEMASYETLCQMCEANLAVGFAPKVLVEDEIKAKKLKVVKTDLKVPQTHLLALLPKGTSHGYVCDLFLQAIKEKYS